MVSNNIQEIGLQELYDYLSRFHLTGSLYEISAINAVTRYGFGSSKLYNLNIPSHIVNWLNDLIAKNIKLNLLSITLSRLSRFLILSGSNDNRSPVLKAGSTTLAKAIYMTEHLYDKDVEDSTVSNASIPMLMGRLASWQLPLQAKRLNVIGRGHLLFSEIPSRLKLDYDFDENMKKFHGIGSIEFMLTGMALWFHCNGTLDEKTNIQIEGLEQIANKELQSVFLRLCSCTYKEYRAFFRKDKQYLITSKKQEYFGLDPFVYKPIIKSGIYPGLSNGIYLVPQPKYLLDKTVNGIFHLLADAEKEIAEQKGNKSENPFRVAFGPVLKEYILMQLLQSSCPTIYILDLDTIDYSSGKIPDIALVSNDTCVLLEVKTTILGLNARTFFDNKLLEHEVQRGNIQKALIQLDEFQDAILAGKISKRELKNVNRVIKILVCYDESPFLNLNLLPVIERQYNNKAQNFQFASISEIELLGQALHEGLNVVELLLEKVDDQTTLQWMIGTYFSQKVDNKKTNKLLHSSFNSLISRMGIKIKQE
ncbi:hypothetical protein ACQKLP_17795 [Chitinophaga sp. NPDC101104]|uniref:hypothetical protein n=1 Tax=Chitinophaga sp. NPDC101104 TaxID=3390561 RepID=UPI003CFF06C7